MTTLPDLQDIRRAAAALEGHIHRTPLLSCRTLGLWLKAENLQRGGAFKIRGALTKVLSLDPEARERGVVAFSSGNHAQGVAIASRLVGIPATIVMPEDAVPHKVEATQSYGATVVQQGVDSGSRGTVAQRIANETGATLIPPFDDPHIIAGQGTVGLEIVAQLPEVDTIVVPLGGGGLLSGIAIAAKALNPSVSVYGVEPAAGNDAQRSLREGRRVTIETPDTIADGARTVCVGELNFAAIQKHVADIVTVDDDALLDAMWRLARYAKLVVEPTGALAAAAVLSGALQPQGKTCVVLSGGNVGADMMARAAARAAQS